MEVDVDLRNISSQPQPGLFPCSLLGWPGWGLGLELKPFCYNDHQFVVCEPQLILRTGLDWYIAKTTK